MVLAIFFTATSPSLKVEFYPRNGPSTTQHAPPPVETSREPASVAPSGGGGSRASNVSTPARRGPVFPPEHFEFQTYLQEYQAAAKKPVIFDSPKEEISPYVLANYARFEAFFPHYEPEKSTRQTTPSTPPAESNVLWMSLDFAAAMATSNGPVEVKVDVPVQTVEVKATLTNQSTNQLINVAVNVAPPPRTKSRLFKVFDSATPREENGNSARAALSSTEKAVSFWYCTNFAAISSDGSKPRISIFFRLKWLFLLYFFRLYCYNFH